MGHVPSRAGALAVVALAAALLAGASTVVAKPKPHKLDGKAVPGELVVRFKPGTTEQEQRDVLASIGAKETGKADKLRIKFAKLTTDDVTHALKRLEDDRRVQYAEPNFALAADQLPNDGSFTQLWGMNNTGQSVNGSAGTADADIDAAEAWDVTTGSSSVVVGLIDTGVDFSHPDLADAKWVNPGEDCAGCRTNGVDDDGNGYVDDWRGWDFANNDNDPFDDEGHGTHVAGTIGATGGNGLGVTGVNWNVRIAALKFLDGQGYGDTADAVRAILYAADKAFPITNNSWGGGEYSQALADAIAEADRRGTLVVAAAGNDALNTDSGGHYPSTYAAPNVISVAATNSNDALAWFSNYGAKSVDLAAPGQSIYSTQPGGAYAFLDGTSMATPHVAGALALAKAAFPSATALGLKALLLRSVDPLSALSGNSATGGRLNVNNAVRCNGAGKVWLESPEAGFDVAIGENVTVTAIGSTCGTPAPVTAVANGTPITLTSRGDGLYTGVFAPTAVGTVNVSVTAGSDTRTVSGTAKDNYRYEDAPFEWIDATLGTRTSIAADDTSVSVALPFTFSFYRQPYTSLQISSNGFVNLGGSAATAYTNTGIPNANAPNGLVAPYWDDLNPGAGGGGVWYRTTGVAPDRKFTVAWVAVPHYSYGDVTLEVTLEEGTNDIVYAYKDVTHGNAVVDYGASATVGVENLTGTVGRQFLYRESKLQSYENAKSLRFTNRPQAPADTTAPEVPSGLTATGGTRRVALDWADNTESDLAGYRVYRNGTIVATVTTGSSYTDTGLADATTYGYTVAAYDRAGNASAQSASVDATTAPPDTTAPAAPTGLTATPSTRQVALDWADNAESDLAGYRVYRNGTAVATTAASTYTDAGLADATTYTYTVTAYDLSANESASSEAASATTPRTIVAKTYLPSGYTLAAGSVYKNRGAVSRLNYDDGVRTEINSAWNGAQYVSEIVVRTTIAAAERSTLASLRVDYDGYASNAGAALSVRVYDFDAAAWVTIDGPLTGVSFDRRVTWTAPASPASYVSSTGEIRVSVGGTRSASFRLLTDLVGFRIEY